MGARLLGLHVPVTKPQIAMVGGLPMRTQLETPLWDKGQKHHNGELETARVICVYFLPVHEHFANVATHRKLIQTTNHENLLLSAG